MPNIIFQIIYLLSGLLRLAGLAVLGVGLGWLSLDLLRKAQGWQFLIAVYLGLLSLTIALAFVGAGAMGAYSIGLGVAIFIWGMPKKKKEEEKKE